MVQMFRICHYNGDNPAGIGETQIKQKGDASMLKFETPLFLSNGLLADTGHSGSPFFRMENEIILEDEIGQGQTHPFFKTISASAATAPCPSS